MFRGRARQLQANGVDGLPRRRAFTLLEVLVALTITLILMALVMEVFSRMGESVNNARSNMELNDMVRNAKHRLIQDLRGITAPTTPPLAPHMHLGYFEYVEGPRVAMTQSSSGSSGGDMGENLSGTGTNNNIVVNSVVGDTDDVMMFTTASFDEHFVGRGGVKSGLTVGIKSRYAEVAWFLRKNPQSISWRADGRAEFYNLHRRIWLVLPNATIFGNRDYANTDLAIRAEGGGYDPDLMPTNLLNQTAGTNPNQVPPANLSSNLGDLTMRECRSLHQPYLWPYEMLYLYSDFNNAITTHSQWNPSGGSSVVPGQLTAGWNRWTKGITLPTLGEQTNGNFPLPNPMKQSTTGVYVLKTTLAPTPPPGWAQQSSYGNGSRVGEDIILTNVVSFDIKAWDPGAPVFRATPVNTAPNNAGVLVPGDAGYARAVDVFNSGSGAQQNANQPVAFGAFADLNYMGTSNNAVMGGTNPRQGGLARYQTYTAPTSTSTQSALQKMEQGGAFKSRLPRPQFANPGDGPLSGATINGFPRPSVYDTWSTHYEKDGIDNDGDGVIDEFTNGVDDNNNGLVDEPNIYSDSTGVITGEQEAPPPYRTPLRGLKITIRTMEQDSKDVKEITIYHEFVPL